MDRRRTRLSRTELYEKVWTIPNLQLAQKFVSNFRGGSTKFILFKMTGTAINSSQSLVQERFKSNHKADAKNPRLRWVSHFLPNRETAQKLGLTKHTVSNYLFRIYEKLGISTRVELVLYALRQKQQG